MTRQNALVQMMTTAGGGLFARLHNASTTQLQSIVPHPMYLGNSYILIGRSLTSCFRSVSKAPVTRLFSTDGPLFAAAYSMPQAPKITSVDALPADEAKWYAMPAEYTVKSDSAKSSSSFSPGSNSKRSRGPTKPANRACGKPPRARRAANQAWTPSPSPP